MDVKNCIINIINKFVSTDILKWLKDYVVLQGSALGSLLYPLNFGFDCHFYSNNCLSKTKVHPKFPFNLVNEADVRLIFSEIKSNAISSNYNSVNFIKICCSSIL